jgi:hypothetical protein
LWLAEPARKAGVRLRASVSERLARSLHELALTSQPLAELPSLGLDVAEIQTACAHYGVDAIVERIRGRGTTAAHLHHIAWHGSALADIGCPPDHPARERLLMDAALFNLAVALTDSLVDDEPQLGAQAGRVLAPDALSARLRSPEDPSAAIAGGERELAAVYGLWDALLVRLGERFAGDDHALAQLAAMLERMHRSEFAGDADRLPAKVLPIEFIGALVSPGAQDALALARLYGELGASIGLLDDWRDLALDMRHMRANQLLMLPDGSVRDGHAGERVRYIARCVRTVASVRRVADEVVERLSAHMARVLASAETISPGARARATSYLRELLEC